MMLWLEWRWTCLINEVLNMYWVWKCINNLLNFLTPNLTLGGQSMITEDGVS